MFHLIRVGEIPTLLFIIMIGIGNEFAVAEEYPRDFDSDVLRRAEQRVSGDEIQRRNSVIDDWLFPSRKEERQLGQQMALMAEEPSIRMEALKKAGINPLTAAAGIAGSAPSSTPQPSSSVNPIGDVAGAIGSVASGYGAIANGVATMFKLKPEIDQIKSEEAKNFAQIGLTNAQTQGVLTDNKYKDEDWRSTLDIKRQQFDNMKAEWHNLKATHEEIIKHIEEMQAQIELSGSQQDYFEAMEQRIKEETRFLSAKNEFCLRNKLYLLESGLDGYIFSMVESGADLSQFDKFIEVYSNYRERVGYASTKGVRDAEIDTAFDKAFNEALGSTDVQAKYAPYFGDLDVLKETLKEMYKELIENPGNPLNFVGKALNLLYQGAAAFTVPKDVHHNPWSKPNVSPKKSN